MNAFIFTFGSNHQTDKGVSLGNRYIVIKATNKGEAVAIMAMTRGRKWSHCYDDAEKAGVLNYGLRSIPLDEIYLSPDVAPRGYDHVMFKNDVPETRKAVTSILSRMSCQIDDCGQADGLDFAIFEHDIIDEKELKCLDTFDNYDDALEAMEKLIGEGRNVDLQLAVSSTSVRIMQPNESA